jgi:ketosteroid isomerase-like protein
MARQADFDAEQALRIVTATFEAWARRDLAAMRAGLADDFIQWHSHIRRDFTLEEHQAMLRLVLAAGRLDYHDIAYTPADRAVLVTCLCDVRMNDGGSACDLPFAMIYTLRGDRIVRCEEYMDGASLPPMNLGSG